MAGDVAADIAVVAGALRDADAAYLVERLEAAAACIRRTSRACWSAWTPRWPAGPWPITASSSGPPTLPPELVFKGGDSVPTRKATEAWFAWAMKHTAFFYIGAGDLMKSILTGKAENVYGIINPGNTLGRGIRFGIAEQNMAMMSCAMAQDTLPGGFRPMTRLCDLRRVHLHDGQLGAHDAHQQRRQPRVAGLLHHAGGARRAGDGRGRAHPPRPVLDVALHRVSGNQGLQAAGCQRGHRDAVPRGAPRRAGGVLGHPSRDLRAARAAMAFRRPGKPSTEPTFTRPFRGNGKPKKVLAVSGGQVMANLLKTLPEIEEKHDVKIVAVTSPQLYEELRRTDPAKAQEILSDEDRQYVMALHNGWPGFLYPFLLPPDYTNRIFGMDHFSRSGKPNEIYLNAGLDPAGLREKILSGSK